MEELDAPPTKSGQEDLDCYQNQHIYAINILQTELTHITTNHGNAFHCLVCKCFALQFPISKSYRG